MLEPDVSWVLGDFVAFRTVPNGEAAIDHQVPHASKIVAFDNRNVGTLSRRKNTPVSRKLGENPSNVAGCKRNRARQRRLLSLHHAVDRCKDAVPIAAGKIGRQGIDKPLTDQEVDVGRVVAPTGCNAVEC